jgi:DNA-binding beta-propeller fold protein YncE
MRSWGKAVSWASVGSVAASVFGAAAGVMLLGACTSCASTVRETAMPVLAAGSFDALEPDQANHRIYLADRNDHGIDVVDTSTATPKFVGTIDLGAPSNGLAYAADRKRLYAGVEGGSVAVVDLDKSSPRYMQVIDKFTVDKTTADLIDYSPKTGRLYVSTSQGGEVVAVDTANDTVMERYNVGSPIEQPRYNPADGKVYVTGHGASNLLQINPADGKVTRKYTLSDRCHPNGMAINPSRDLALVACGSSVILIKLDTGLNKISLKVPGGDIVNYDAGVDRFTVGSSHGPRDSSIAVLDGQGEFVGSVPSVPNAKGVVIDDKSGLAYAVGAAGLVSFAPSQCAPPPDWLTFTGGMAFYVTPMLLFALFLVWYARHRARRDPNAPKRPTWEQLQAEDVAGERERIRALEDAIYGPVVEPGFE